MRLAALRPRAPPGARRPGALPARPNPSDFPSAEAPPSARAAPRGSVDAIQRHDYRSHFCGDAGASEVAHEPLRLEPLAWWLQGACVPRTGGVPLEGPGRRHRHSQPAAQWPGRHTHTRHRHTRASRGPRARGGGGGGRGGRRGDALRSLTGARAGRARSSRPHPFLQAAGPRVRARGPRVPPTWGLEVDSVAGELHEGERWRVRGPPRSAARYRRIVPQVWALSLVSSVLSPGRSARPRRRPAASIGAGAGADRPEELLEQLTGDWRPAACRQGAFAGHGLREQARNASHSAGAGLADRAASGPPTNLRSVVPGPTGELGAPEGRGARARTRSSVFPEALHLPPRGPRPPGNSSFRQTPQGF